MSSSSPRVESMAMHGYVRGFFQEAPSPHPPPAPWPSSPAAHADGGHRSGPGNIDTPLSDPASFDSSLDLNSHFSPSMIIILVVLLSAFFFMGFFAVYVRRCSSDDDVAPRGSSRGGRRDGLALQQQGVDTCLVESFPMVSYAAVKKKGCNECVVCLTDFEGSENLRQLPKCKHVFHPGCIDMWLESHTTCPLCRRSLVNADKWSVSFRWGSSRGSSVSGRLNEDGSVRSRGSESQTPRERVGEFSPRGPHASSISSELTTREVTGILSTPRDNSEPLPRPPGRRRLRRSHSTGDSLLKGALSRAAFLAPEAARSGTPSSGCLPLSPFPLHRSRSVGLDGEEGQEEVIMQVGPSAAPPSSDDSRLGGGGGWGPLKRALSPFQREPTSVGEASTSASGRQTFSRLAL